MTQKKMERFMKVVRPEQTIAETVDWTRRE
jgi:hypothetical protein